MRFAALLRKLLLALAFGIAGALFFIALVMAFVFVGDGLRDAADPYGEAGK